MLRLDIKFSGQGLDERPSMRIAFRKQIEPDRGSLIGPAPCRFGLADLGITDAVEQTFCGVTDRPGLVGQGPDLNQSEAFQHPSLSPKFEVSSNCQT